MDRRIRALSPTAWVAVGLLSGAMAGCGASGSKGLVAQSATYVDDVPIPRGYRLIDRQSRDVMAGRNRVVHHVYRGLGRPLEIRNFYEEQMPYGGWRRRVVENNNGTYVLRYEKDGEDCSIRITPSWAGWIGETQVELSILPRSTGADMLATDSDPANQGISGRP